MSSEFGFAEAFDVAQGAGDGTSKSAIAEGKFAGQTGRIDDLAVLAQTFEHLFADDAAFNLDLREERRLKYLRDERDDGREILGGNTDPQGAVVRGRRCVQRAAQLLKSSRQEMSRRVG